mgnify:CR=1 FL=1
MDTIILLFGKITVQGQVAHRTQKESRHFFLWSLMEHLEKCQPNFLQDDHEALQSQSLS